MYSVQCLTGGKEAGPRIRHWFDCSVALTMLSLVGLVAFGFALVEPTLAASRNVVQYQTRKQPQYMQQWGRQRWNKGPTGQGYIKQFGRPAGSKYKPLPQHATPTGQQPDLSSLNRQNELRRCTAACQGQSRICSFGDTTCSSMSFGAVSACVQGCYQRIPRY
jgi:hypothetical protein